MQSTARLRTPDQADRSGQVQSLVRALSILEALSDRREGLTLTEVARAVRLPRSTAHRLLTTMEGLHFVEFSSATQGWSVGLRAYRVGAAVDQTRVIERLAQPILRSLMLEVGETVSVMVPDGTDVRIVAQVSPQAALTPRPPGVGELLPAHACAAGKAILSSRSPAAVQAHIADEPLIARTQRSLTTGETLTADLERARRRGFAVDDEEYLSGLRCVAVPILDGRSVARAALSISGPAARLRDDWLGALGRRLAPAAERFADALAGLHADSFEAQAPHAEAGLPRRACGLADRYQGTSR